MPIALPDPESNKPIRFYSRMEWIAWFKDNERGNEMGPTPKQLKLIKSYNIPYFVYIRLTKSLAAILIARLIQDHNDWRDRQRAKEAAKATEQQEKIEASRDPATGLIGAPDRCQWALRIKTDLTPYLNNLKEGKPPSTRKLIDYALTIDDAAYWIAFRQADLKADTFDRMMQDARKRKLSSQPRVSALSPAWDGL